jgi:hypothetical protein
VGTAPFLVLSRRDVWIMAPSKVSQRLHLTGTGWAGRESYL